LNEARSKCVILAAGEGSRLRGVTKGEHKTFLKFFGLTLIERLLLSFKEAGIGEFIVVTGYRPEELSDFLGDGDKFGVKISFVHAKDWELGNGASLKACSDVLPQSDKFFLVMSDHLFAPYVIRDFVSFCEGRNDCWLLVDRKGGIQNIDDATKVSINDGRVVRLGKKLEEYNGIDCGLFYLNGGVFSYLEDASKKGLHTITDAMNLLSERSELLAFCPDDLIWQDIDEPDDLKEAKRKLLKSLRNPKDGLISRYINRRLSIPITASIAGLNISPSFISFVSFLIGVGAAVAFFLQQAITGAVLTQLCSVVDGVDGELARLKFRKTPFGGLLDSILDRYADSVIVIAIVWLLWQQHHSFDVIVIGGVALVGFPMSMLLKEKFHSSYGRPYIPQKFDGLTDILLLNRDGRLFLIMLGGIFSCLYPVLLYLAVLTNLHPLIRLFLIRRQSPNP